MNSHDETPMVMLLLERIAIALELIAENTAPLGDAFGLTQDADRYLRVVTGEKARVRDR